MAHTPNFGYRRRITWVDAEGRKRAAIATENNVCALVSTVAGRCLDNRVIVNMRGSYRRSDPTQVAAIKQIRIAIFA